MAKNKAKNKMFLVMLALSGFVLCLGTSVASAKPFVPEQPTMASSELKAGETGYLLTVLQGMEPTKIPVRIMSVIPQKGEVSNLIMVQIMPTKDPRAQELASGMSGSPVYVRGKLVGAIRQGWNFSDHKLGLATPIHEMCGIFAREQAPEQSTVEIKAEVATPAPPEDSIKEPKPETESAPEITPELEATPKATSIDSKYLDLLRSQGLGLDFNNTGRIIELAEPVAISGLSQTAAATLARSLGTTIAEGPAASSTKELLIEQDPLKSTLKPGDAIAALLAWGDVEVAATGTVTATAADGRFLAFGHPFLRRGNVGYPAARAMIHETVYSQSFPFKIASPVSLVGTITQDREPGVGGRTDFFAPSISTSLVFKDKDHGTRDERRIRVIADQNLSAKLLEGIYTGLLDDAWGRTGQGTMAVTLRIDGKNIMNGWTRSDMFYSDTNVSAIALKQVTQIMNAFLTQPFDNNMPLGFYVEVEATEEPLAVLIEDVEAPEKAKPGEEIKITVTLRPWRRQPLKREFTLTIPKDASGVCELTVRGGGSQPMSQLALEGGWRAIDSQARMLEEIQALDANNDLIIDLQCDSIATILSQSKSSGSKESGKNTSEPNSKSANKIGSENLLPEEREFLSETKDRRLRDGTLKIYKADRFVDGLMRRIITIEPAEPADSKTNA